MDSKPYRKGLTTPGSFKWNPFDFMGDAPASLRFFPDDEGGNDKKFSQDDVNRMMAEHKRQLQADNQQLKDQLKEMMGTVKELNDWKSEVDELLQAASKGADDDDDDDSDDDDDDTRGTADDDDDDGVIVKDNDEVRKAIDWVNKKWEKRIKVIEGKLKEAEDNSKTSEERRRFAERDTILTDALQKADAISVDHGLKIYRENLQYDEDEGKWVFRTSEGLELTPEEGVKESLPPFLKRANVNSGSGAQDMKGAQLQTHIADLRRKVVAAEENAKKAPNNSIAIRTFVALKKELQTAEKQVQK